MDRDTAQLADILVDWCGADLEAASARDPVVVAREAVKCLVFTLANCQDAREILARLVREARREIEEAHREDEDR